MKKSKIKHVLRNKPTLEGAGVRLNRVFGFNEVPLLDPFLLLDDFRSGKPDDYIKGFPWHPHRGIETITYMIGGRVEHGDSMGNQGVIGAGDVQWMTAGSGIIHQEMPKGDHNGYMGGFQLWANLPASQKMMHPRYRDVISDQIPEIIRNNGTKIKIICGEIDGTKGPVQDIVTDPAYLDITIPAGAEFTRETKFGHTIFAYVIEGETQVRDAEHVKLAKGMLALFDYGEKIVFFTEGQPVRFLLISGRPIGEPVAWYGPIVMNTEDELQLAFAEYDNGTFIKYN